MKKISLLLLITILVLTFACNQGENNNDNKIEEHNKDDSSNSQIESDIDDDEKDNIVKNDDQPKINDNIKMKKINITDIKKGNIIEGMEVSKVSYRSGEYYSIVFKGEMEIEGTVYYNEFDYAWNISVDEEYIPESIIIFDGQEQEFFNIISIRNNEEFENAVGSDNINQIKNGGEVKIKYNFQNFEIGHNFEKGPFGVAFADYKAIK